MMLYGVGRAAVSTASPELRAPNNSMVLKEGSPPGRIGGGRLRQRDKEGALSRIVLTTHYNRCSHSGFHFSAPERSILTAQECQRKTILYPTARSLAMPG